MGFRETVKRDIKRVFLNPREFGEPHKVDGKKINIIVDENELDEREKLKKNMAEGLHVRRLLFYAAAKDYGPPPLVGRQLELDGEYYTVTNAADEGGMYAISLEERRP